MIKQGKRRRHPGRLLHEFAGIAEGTEHATNNWEKAMLYENERQEIPEEYRPTDELQGAATQLGLIQTAHNNWRTSKQKLNTMYLAGV